MLTDEDIIAAGNAIRPVLAKLVDLDTARSLKARLTDALTLDDPTDAADEIETAIGQHPAAKLWFDAYLKHTQTDRNLAYFSAHLPGRSTTPINFPIYTCTCCQKYLWLRESSTQPIPTCPQGNPLVPYMPPES